MLPISTTKQPTTILLQPLYMYHGVTLNAIFFLLNRAIVLNEELREKDVDSTSRSRFRPCR